ncbi:hypothetical protein F444_03103 [Phytophthora nicotianae P1976]|uniref:Uncharacterized protein n=2 Tax=Phytophthora nicotianae P1976 TaxID=1317066 RepID=A0A081AV86_PHYNI|nr:hypothetical protein F444_03103 [Phytophthora nicotianae P1976]
MALLSSCLLYGTLPIMPTYTTPLIIAKTPVELLRYFPTVPSEVCQCANAPAAWSLAIATPANQIAMRTSEMCGYRDMRGIQVSTSSTSSAISALGGPRPQPQAKSSKAATTPAVVEGQEDPVVKKKMATHSLSLDKCVYERRRAALHQVVAAMHSAPLLTTCVRLGPHMTEISMTSSSRSLCLMTFTFGTHSSAANAVALSFSLAHQQH